MKRPFVAFITAALAAVALIGTPALAQKPAKAAKKAGKHQEKAIDKRLDRLSQELGLTDQQKTDIKAILETQRSKAKAIHDDKNLTPEQQKTQLRELQKQTRQDITAKLTADQVAKLKALHHHAKGAGTATGAKPAEAPNKP